MDEFSKTYSCLIISRTPWWPWAVENSSFVL